MATGTGVASLFNPLLFRTCANFSCMTYQNFRWDDFFMLPWELWLMLIFNLTRSKLIEETASATSVRVPWGAKTHPQWEHHNLKGWDSGQKKDNEVYWIAAVTFSFLMADEMGQLSLAPATMLSWTVFPRTEPKQSPPSFSSFKHFRQVTMWFDMENRYTNQSYANNNVNNN